MAKIKIAELDIDTSALVKATSDLKKELDSLKKEQKELTKAGETSSKRFVENAADIKTLSKAYNDNVKALSQNTQAISDQANRTELLTLALNTEVTSIKEAREQNKLLNKLRNEANATTAQGQEEIKALNAVLDANNEFIKENADAYTQQKINIGNYSDSVKEALGELNLLNGGIGGFVSRANEAGGAGNLLKSSLTAAAQGMMGMVRASLAFIATPIGAVITALVAAFALVQNALSRSEEATAKLSRAFSGITGIFQGVLKSLEPIGEFLIDVLVKNIEAAEKAFFSAAEGIASALEFLGFDETAKSVSNFTKGLQEASEASKALTDAEKQYTDAQREGRLVQLEYQKEAEKLRQIRDDETKSFQERIKANEELGATLQAQLQEELALAQTALNVANLRLQVEGETTAALDARAEALTEIADIQERITGQESEQLTNRVALQKEATDRAIQNQQEELDLFIAQQGVKAKSLEEEVKLAQQVADRKLEILEAELKAGNISQAKFDKEALEARQEVLTAQTNLAIDNAMRELNEYNQLNQSKLESDKFFSEQSLIQEQERLNGIAEKRREFEAIRLEEGVITEQQYNDAINLINEENRIALEEAEAEREEARKEKEAIDLENRAILQEEQFNNQFELERFREQKRFEAEKAEAIKSGASLELINRKHAANMKKIDDALQESKIAALGATLDTVAGILGEESALGKAAAFAQAIINTYQGITAGVALGYPAAIPAVAAAAATGFASVSKIAGTNTKFEKGGLQEIGGNRHIAGGTKFVGEDGTAFEAEKGELIGVMNRNAARHFMAFNNSFPSGKSTPNFFQGGGIVARGVSSSSIDPTELARATEQAVSKLPPPIVTVEDINAGQSSTAEVVSGADL